MQKSTFIIQKMDCAAEEQLIRLKLEPFKTISTLQFDLPGRRLDVYHTGSPTPIADALHSMQLDTHLARSGAADEAPAAGQPEKERTLLWLVLLINFFFFALELWMGFMANSMGLIADSLDMLADSFVYGLALFAVGRSAQAKKNVARASGYFQFLLAVSGIVEVVRRFLGFGETPVYQTMMIISLLALIGNAASLVLLQKSQSREAHMRASILFTSNDVIINIGVMIAGGLVFVSGSKIPDLVIGTMVFFIVARGAYRIFQIAK